MDKILTLAWKELYGVYRDRALLLFLIGTPLAISLILGFAFGGNSGNLTISDIPVAVVNLDEGKGGSNFGEMIASILLSEQVDVEQNQSCPIAITANSTQTQSLDEILNAERLTDPAVARAGVEEGLFVAAVIIPADFTQKISPSQDLNITTEIELETVNIEVYGSGANKISAMVVRSITEAVVTPFITGNIGVRATLQTIMENPANLVALGNADQTDFAGFGCGFMPDLGTITLERGALNDVQARTAFEQVMIGLGSAQAVFFALFTATASVRSIYEDRKSWVLQRLLSTPTPRSYVLAGKLIGSLFLVTMQILILLLALSAIASVINGSLTFLWGNNILLLILLLLAVSIAVTGVGVFVVGIAASPEQAILFGSLASLALALLGGAFGFQFGELSKVSLIFWGVDGFNTLSTGSSDIMLNLLVLFVQGAILFGVGAWFFSRRVEV